MAIDNMEAFLDAGHPDIPPTVQEVKEAFKLILNNIGLPATFGSGCSVSTDCSNITPVYINWNC